MIKDLSEILKQNAYPGRGVALGVTPDGQGIAVYFIMGRSVNSRNRVFTEKDGGILTEAADPAKVEDPRLILYAPVRRLSDVTIVTNGDQTDTIIDELMAGGTFEQALSKRTFEPDAPNYTSRISGVIERQGAGFLYKLSILKSADGDPSSVRRFFFHYPQPIGGQGHFIHTYQADGDPLPVFCGEPVTVGIPDDIEAFGRDIWDSLNPENKVSLFVRCIEPDGGERTWIYNRYERAGRA